MKTELPPIPLNPTKSSTVTAVGYDEGTKRLAVQFRAGGATYHYQDVPKELFDKLGKAESLGKFVGANIAKQFNHVKIPPAGQK